MSNCSFAIQKPEYMCQYYTLGRKLNGVEYKQDTFTIHQIWGHCNNASLVKILNDGHASCNYSVHDNGDITLMVDEANRSWCSSSSANDVRACTIECSTDRAYPYKCTDKVLDALVRLCVDWCKRNGIRKMIWINDKTKGLEKQKNLADGEGIFTIHEWFYNKPCPGDYIKGKIQWICDEVNKQIATSEIKVGDIVPMEVYEIKDGYAYGKTKIDEPQPEPTPPPTPEPPQKEITVGSKVTINSGAKAGGLNDKYRGKTIDSKYANGKYVDTVTKVATHYGVQEACLKNIVTWVAFDSLTLAE